MSTPSATPPDAPGPGEAVTARPAELGATLVIQAASGWVRWSRFAYELPPDHAGRRRTLWRQLKRRDAVKLKHGEWAIAHDENDETGLAELVAAVKGAGGTCLIDPVGRSGVDDVERHVRLCRSCEALWDAFFNAADRVARGTDEGVSVADVDRLRQRYVSELVRDVVLSDSARRAAQRLDELADEALLHTGRAAESPAMGTRVEILAGWALDTSAVRYLAAVQPLPSLLAERSFRAFEEGTYQPSPGRIPLRHGVFVFTCSRDSRDAMVASLSDRLETFATYVG